MPIWQRFVDEGRTPPQKEYFEQPEVEQHLVWVWSAFSDLSTERQFGMGTGPIPYSKIREYARDELGLSGEAHERFCRLIRKVDSGYLSVVNAPRKTELQHEEPESPQEASRMRAKKNLIARKSGRA